MSGVSDRDDPAAVRFCESVESGHSAHGDAAAVADRLGITAAPLRMDSQAKYAVVARGEADIYLRLPTRADYREKIWDHAAGALIVAEAGGIVTDIHGRPLEFHHGRELTANRGVIVTNGRLHDRVLEAIRELGIGLRVGLEASIPDGGSGWRRADADRGCDSTRSSHSPCEVIAVRAKIHEIWNLESGISDRRTRSILLRGLGVVYLAAFGSLAVQLDGLIGSHGILPAAEYLDRSGRSSARRLEAYWRLPTLFWLDASDRRLARALLGRRGAQRPGDRRDPARPVPGAPVGVLPVADRGRAGVPRLSVGFLLLESGLLALLLTPWGWRLGRANDEPWRFAIWLFRWLVFRLMFLSGVVKLTSGDPAWLSLEGPRLPLSDPAAADLDELVHPPDARVVPPAVGRVHVLRRAGRAVLRLRAAVLRRIGFVSLVLLQLLIAATGNYGFFNLLAIVLCLSVLDDRDFQAVGAIVRRPPRGTGFQPVSEEATGQMPVPPSIRPWSLPRRVAVGIVGGILVAVTAAQTIEDRLVARGDPDRPIQVLARAIEPLRSANSYGLFRVMTTKRPEITVEGSDDGVSWKPYRFRWKPCELDRRPRFTTPHMPRLDWQMWFAALGGDCRDEPWFLRFEQRLLEGSPEVLALLRENPFPDRPPRYLRARLSLYDVHPMGLARLVDQPGRRPVLPADGIALVGAGSVRRSE